MLFEILKTFLKLAVGRGSVRAFSQFGEDAVVGAMLRKKKGVYVDVGAFHPTLYSNTYALYRRGWRGIAIDPKRDVRMLFRVFRPGDVFYEVGVGGPGRKKLFLFSDSAYNTFDEHQSLEYQRRGMVCIDTQDVEVRPLRDIVHENDVREIDVLSVDVEGLDVEVLKTHDWNIPTHIVIIEDHNFNSKEPEKSEGYRFLIERGYMLTGLCGPSLIFSR